MNAAGRTLTLDELICEAPVRAHVPVYVETADGDRLDVERVDARTYDISLVLSTSSVQTSFDGFTAELGDLVSEYTTKAGKPKSKLAEQLHDIVSRMNAWTS